MIFKFLIENSENTMGRKESIEDTGRKKSRLVALETLLPTEKKIS